MYTICLTANNTVGCTFLDWSLHFLNGQTKYYRIKEKEWIPLIDNPLSFDLVENAHGHNKNCVAGLTNTKILTSLVSSSQLCTFNAYPEQLDIICDQLGIGVDQLDNAANLKSVQDHRLLDYNNLIQHCLDQHMPVVYIYADPKVVGYFWQHRNIQRLAFADQEARSIDDLEQETENIFFKNSLDAWQQLELDNIWDTRERMALNIRPYDTADFWSVGSASPMHWINCQELWHDTESVVINLLGQFGLLVDQSRLQQWLPIVANWQKIHHKNLKFYNNLSHIVDCIVMGWHYKLDTLTLQQEAIIQHCLIYQHNLNLKTWNLLQFPDNTLKLHQLLEENIHNVDKIY